MSGALRQTSILVGEETPCTVCCNAVECGQGGGCVGWALCAPLVRQGVLSEVEAELLRAQLFPAYNSSHEGHAVILEELDELWDEIKDNKRAGTMDRQRAEALQVASTAVRFVIDICDK